MKQKTKLRFALHGCVREKSTSSPLPLFPLVSHPSQSAGLQKCFFIAQGEELALLAGARHFYVRVKQGSAGWV